MQITNLTKRAFTLLEVLLAAVIFVVSVAGIFATLSAVRVPVHQKERALTAAVFGQQVLEGLRSQVSASQINNVSPVCYNYTNQLIFGGPWPAGTQKDQNGTTYSMNYTVSCASPGGGCPAGSCPVDTAMMVTLIITFPDAT